MIIIDQSVFSVDQWIFTTINLKMISKEIELKQRRIHSEIKKREFRY